MQARHQNYEISLTGGVDNRRHTCSDIHWTLGEADLFEGKDITHVRHQDINVQANGKYTFLLVKDTNPVCGNDSILSVDEFLA